MIGLLLSLAIFYPDLMLAKSGSLLGDHLEQHYPWTFLLWQSIRNFTIPFWTPHIHCGMPIAAESQVGVFYLPNLILSFLMPFHWAYSYQNVLHFLLAGLGTYLYTRRIGLNAQGAFVAAFIFLFGSAYGGAYYNITSLKTISWFPLILFSLENFYVKGKYYYVLLCALFLFQSLVAGYMQVAVLLYIMFLVYVFFRIFLFHGEESYVQTRVKILWKTISALVLSFLFATPQILLSLDLALQSNRMGLAEEFAYIGSLSPIALSTILLPILQGLFRGNCIYGGVFSVILLFVAFSTKRLWRLSHFRIWACFTLVATLLALGRWNPLYVLLIKITHFYSFRTPMKFLVFICFGLAILSGYGFQEFYFALHKTRFDFDRDKIFRVYCLSMGMCGAMVTMIYLFLTSWRATTVKLGRWCIEHFIYGRVGHPYSLEVYYEKLDSFLDVFLSLYARNYWGLWGLWNITLIAIGFILVLYLHRTPVLRRRIIYFGFAFLFVDLYAFSFFDIKKDFAPYRTLEQTSAIIFRLLEEKKQGKVLRIHGFRKAEERLPLVPSMNLLYDIEDVGAYSPFVIGRYHQTIGRLGNVNDSNFAYAPEPKFLLDRIPLLSGLGVSHIFSKVELEDGRLDLVFHDKGNETYLYRNRSKPERAYFVNSVEVASNWEELKKRFMEVGFNPKKTLLLEASELQKVPMGSRVVLNFKSHAKLKRVGHGLQWEHWKLETSGAGFFVLANSYYPGWEARVNNEVTPLIRAYGLFQAAFIEQVGTYDIVFQFSPQFLPFQKGKGGTLQNLGKRI